MEEYMKDKLKPLGGGPELSAREIEEVYEGLEGDEVDFL